MDGRSGWCGAMSRRFIFNNSVVSHASVEKYCLLVFLCGGKDGWEVPSCGCCVWACSARDDIFYEVFMIIKLSAQGRRVPRPVCITARPPYFCCNYGVNTNPTFHIDLLKRHRPVEDLKVTIPIVNLS